MAKCFASGCFLSWFLLQDERQGRSTGMFKEEHPRCNRMRDSPIFYMRRRLNGKEGKVYGQRNRDYWDTPRRGPNKRQIQYQKDSGSEKYQQERTIETRLINACYYSLDNLPPYVIIRDCFCCLCPFFVYFCIVVSFILLKTRVWN